MCASCCSAAGGNSGSKPFWIMTSRAMACRSMCGGCELFINFDRDGKDYHEAAIPPVYCCGGLSSDLDLDFDFAGSAWVGAGVAGPFELKTPRQIHPAIVVV